MKVLNVRILLKKKKTWIKSDKISIAIIIDHV